jgi:uncharacterized OB-fold protein
MSLIRKLINFLTGRTSYCSECGKAVHPHEMFCSESCAVWFRNSHRGTEGDF